MMSVVEWAFSDGPILRLMLDVVQARIRTSMQFHGVGIIQTNFPLYLRKALEEESCVRELTDLKLLGVRIQWKTDGQDG